MPELAIVCIVSTHLVAAYIHRTGCAGGICSAILGVRAAAVEALNWRLVCLLLLLAAAL